MADWLEWARNAFRNFSRDAQAKTDQVQDWLKYQRQLARLNQQLRELAAQERELCEMMGRKVYALHQNQKVANQDLLALCLRLEETKGQREHKQQEIQALQAPPSPEPELTDVTPLAADSPEPASQPEAVASGESPVDAEPASHPGAQSL